MTTRKDIRFHALHQQGLLRLPNVWDAGTARLAQAAGAQALATSSAAVAWAQGWPDGNALPTDRLLAVVAAIAAASDLPLSVDIEAGYSDEPAQVAALVTRLLGAGVVGINIEDGGAPVALLCDKIAAVRAAAKAEGVALYINARTDVYLRGLADEAGRVDEALRRGRLYREAGADGLFVPGVTDIADMARLAAEAGMPLNVLARASIDTTRLEAAGVRRYSAGSVMAETVDGLLLAMMRDFVADGRLNPRGVDALRYPELNELMTRS